MDYSLKDPQYKLKLKQLESEYNSWLTTQTISNKKRGFAFNLYMASLGIVRVNMDSFNYDITTVLRTRHDEYIKLIKMWSDLGLLRYYRKKHQTEESEVPTPEPEPDVLSIFE